MDDLQTQMETYLSTLTEKEMKAYEIAKDLLGMSFQLEKSLGFIEWQEKQREHS